MTLAEAIDGIRRNREERERAEDAADWERRIRAWNRDSYRRA
jgi:hypothetical protein